MALYVVVPATDYQPIRRLITVIRRAWVRRTGNPLHYNLPRWLPSQRSLLTSAPILRPLEFTDISWRRPHRVSSVFGLLFAWPSLSAPPLLSRPLACDLEHTPSRVFDTGISRRTWSSLSPRSQIPRRPCSRSQRRAAVSSASTTCLPSTTHILTHTHATHTRARAHTHTPTCRRTHIKGGGRKHHQQQLPQLPASTAPLRSRRPLQIALQRGPF